MENSESRIAPSPGAASDDSASPSNQHPEPAGQASPGCSAAEGGGASEAADRLDFDLVPLRHRADGFTPEKQRGYVEALADCGVAREAAARVGLSEQAINRVRRRADARSFDRACEAAHVFGARRIRSIAFERAIEGTLKGHYYHGELISQERVYDNRLLTYLYGKTEHLLARDEERSRSICANWEAHMDALEQGLDAPPQPARKEAAPKPEFDGHEVFEDEEGIWWTEFPPPAGFDGEERGEPGDPDYQRTLSAEEQEVVDSDCAEQDAEILAEEIGRRDRFFGFEGGICASLEAETYETSEPSEAVHPDPRPIEYKSAFPPGPEPCPMLAAEMRVHAEARRRGETSRFIRDRAPPPVAAADVVRPASPEERWKRVPLRASAPPREPDSGRGRTSRTFPPRRAIPR